MGRPDLGRPADVTTGPTQPHRGHELARVRPQPGPRTMLGVLVVAAVAVSAVASDPGQATLNLRAAGQLLASVVRPDLSAEMLLSTLPGALALTVAYAVAGTSVALVVGLPGAALVSGTLARRRAVRVPLVAASRGAFASLRGLHELVWALVAVSILGLHPLAGILAIGVPYGATIARVLGERLQDISEGPLDALRSTGASPAQILCYGRVPIALPDMVAYVMYRFECALRAAAVLGVVGLGGIGFQIEIAMADHNPERVWPLVAGLVAVIVAVDWASGRLRARVMA